MNIDWLMLIQDTGHMALTIILYFMALLFSAVAGVGIGETNVRGSTSDDDNVIFLCFLFSIFFLIAAIFLGFPQ